MKCSYKCLICYSAVDWYNTMVIHTGITEKAFTVFVLNTWRCRALSREEGGKKKTWEVFPGATRVVRRVNRRCNSCHRKERHLQQVIQWKRKEWKANRHPYCLTDKSSLGKYHSSDRSAPKMLPKGEEKEEEKNKGLDDCQVKWIKLHIQLLHKLEQTLAESPIFVSVLKGGGRKSNLWQRFHRHRLSFMALSTGQWLKTGIMRCNANTCHTGATVWRREGRRRWEGRGHRLKMKGN